LCRARPPRCEGLQARFVLREDEAADRAAAVDETGARRPAGAGRLARTPRGDARVNALAGHTNTYHTYGFEEALAGIAGAGYRYVELSAVPGWTEHVDLDTPPADVRRKLEDHGLEAVSLSGHSDLTTPEGLEHGIKAVRWAADYGLPIMNTAVGGHQSADENEAAFLGNVGKLADAAESAGVIVALEIHGDIM